MTNDKDRALFIVYYDSNGEAVGVEVTELGLEKGCTVRELGKDLKVADLIEMKKEVVELKATPLLHVKSSPGCWIIAGGRPLCICCG